MKEISRYARNDNALYSGMEESVCGVAAATNAPLYYSKPVIPSRRGGEESPAWKSELSNDTKILNLKSGILNLEP